MAKIIQEDYQRIIIRYEKLTSTYKALVTIASIIIHLRYGILRRLLLSKGATTVIGTPTSYLNFYPDNTSTDKQWIRSDQIFDPEL
jgi:hypothetical protein